MLQDSAVTKHGVKRGLKLAAIRSRTIVLAAPSLEVDGGKIRPKVAGRVSNNRMRPSIETGVPRLVPRVNAGQAKVTAPGLHVESSDHSNIPSACLSASMVTPA